MGIFGIPNTGGDLAGNKWSLYCELTAVGSVSTWRNTKVVAILHGHHVAVTVNTEIILLASDTTPGNEHFYFLVEVRLAQTTFQEFPIEDMCFLGL